MLAQLDTRLKRTLPNARIEAIQLPGCHGMRLGLINADFPTGPLDAEVMHAVILEPAYWAFCWGSGLALAALLLEQPHWVAGKRVLDLGSGSGVAGIAAAMAGARAVTACDTDPDARLATETNAVLNDVEIRVIDRLETGNDLILMADVLYDEQNLPLLEAARRHAQQVLVADSRITELPDPGYREIARIRALTYPNLGEFDEYNTAHVFHFGSRRRK
ncbi:MAG: 50S ribosomal protein L11 methyltransferase [Pseudomonadales bacterium]|jgi:predicted nicotinamide N-methyase|nr:50S ribosomal protein L11 methyltransferase [Pseudomonadales bacterium]MDP6470531.1 50S ribosomal protein L11 methyltransferase [Pseudomonadales bacterium]MDP6827833.1 50S ribosomal protein L11 methyltransferase [Pseudomonadales bacterium]MDP6972165.1 50S ribosomal protein L11 methyltransferase [Pseudomonadales bacterium]